MARTPRCYAYVADRDGIARLPRGGNLELVLYVNSYVGCKLLSLKKEKRRATAVVYTFFQLHHKQRSVCVTVNWWEDMRLFSHLGDLVCAAEVFVFCWKQRRKLRENGAKCRMFMCYTWLCRGVCGIASDYVQAKRQFEIGTRFGNIQK